MKKIFLMIIFLFMMLVLNGEVVNPDRPQKGEWDFKLEKLWEINRLGEEVFGRPLQVLVTENGRVAVYDSKLDINRLFTPDGQLITSFGKKGEGPGEIKNQEWMYAVNGKLAVPDGGKVHYFSQDGIYIQSQKKPFGLNVVYFLSEDEFISAPLTIFQMTGGRARISLYHIKNQIEKTIADFKVFNGGIGSSGSQVYDVIVAGLSPMMTIGYHDGRLYYGMNNAYTINICTLDAEFINKFSVNRKKRPVSSSAKKERFKDSNMPDDAIKQIVSSLPDEIACFDRIEIHNSLIFVTVADLEHWKESGRKPKQIDIFSCGGKYLYRAFLRFDEGSRLFQTPFSNLVISGDYLYAALEDANGEAILAKFKITLPRESIK
jgi:hypothetical protein